ncbi:hypothetical protein TREMEDRAFT_33924 [Tremella mesenterica DSM 1558]|uniref:uncharacterized protein n=1 Tax=Tremella mesenterica (strain ATCC 24925 / CBS 8224 / DSM 1558 / NBRC 9311 / NRRL Y-6157 / RJB 2259-6 / UBC 559-6) TaxID=578456 RepID=UPI0003F4A2EE|nr:uncharacterized protein TREMEDRAFT_33924 [Tremella mesenterica DSM 1558]EIW67429.1 hypothetical protein TREMEDRAFT_33924 [Tremella mesenterica DSM 1558]
MAPLPATPSSSKPKLAPPKTAPAQGRMTRLRAAKENTASPAIAAVKPTGLLARSLRTVSDRMKEKERERERKLTASTSSGTSGCSESLQAFLRIRPPPSDGDGTRVRPYLETQGDNEVIMRAPIDPNRPHIPKPPHIYSFDRVFPSLTSQSAFFTQTALPLVDKLLNGENGLLFAYGVSNSGKTYSISGGQSDAPEDRGVLPRAIDVVFNSIKGFETKRNLRCTGLADVELVDRDEHAGMLAVLPLEKEGRVSDVCRMDRDFSYAVFVSYAEVYNEKIFDLLESVLPSSSSPTSSTFQPAGMKRTTSTVGLSNHVASSMALAAMANGGAGVLKRHALSLKNDPEGNGKYIAGLNEIRVRTREEALAVLRAGQRARQVFGTLANRESSRSHGIFTIKIVRIHNGAPEDPDSASVSRLAIVDLAGSERTKNTQTTGDRLKEAGNINKSLMVLGQCLEVLRSNQQKLATPIPPGSKRKLAMVPFRHSKLTEIFQNFFVGDGRAVVMVHVNPYDTGFDENSHVMRFSAIARDIQTTAMNPPKSGFPLLKRQISTQFSAFKHAVSGPMKIKVVVPVLPQDKGKDKFVTHPFVGRSRETDDFVMVEEELEVVEESESDDEEEKDWLVEHLFEQLREYKTRLYESEMRNAIIEIEVREEVTKEMQEQMQKMHVEYSQRFADQVQASELKTDRKIDILSRTLTPGPSRLRPRDDESSDISQADMSLDVGDESFESAYSGEASVLDPFVVKPLVTVIPAIAINGQGQSSTHQLQGRAKHAPDQPDDINRQDQGRMDNDLTDDDDGEEDEDDEVTEEDEDDSGEEDEDESEEEEEQEEGTKDGREIDENESDMTYDETSISLIQDEVESSFSVSDLDSVSISSDEPSRKTPNRGKRMSSVKNTSVKKNVPQLVSPTKSISSVMRTPGRGIRSPVKTGQAVGTHVSSTVKDQQKKGDEIRDESGVLSESKTQETMDSDEDVLPLKGSTKKKRTLGKKVITEEEMDMGTGLVKGTNVRRLIKTFQ